MPALESVEMKAQLEQIGEPAIGVDSIGFVDRWRNRAGRRDAPVGPGGGNERPAAVGQDREHKQCATPAQAADHIKRLPLEGVASAGDRHPSRNIPAMGSLWWLPSIRVRTID